MDNNISLENKENIVYEYEFIPYKKIGSILLDKIEHYNWQPNGVQFLEELEFNHVFCKAVAIDSPENKKYGQEKYVYIIYNNKRVALTCMFNQFIENISQICDDIVIDEVQNKKMKIAYSKTLGIVAYADQFKDEQFYCVQTIHFMGKDIFDEKINEIKEYSSENDKYNFEFNFKLVLIENLLYNSKNEEPSFYEEYNAVLDSNEYKDEKNNIINNNLYDGLCQTLYNYLKQLIISDEDILKIQQIYFDSSSQIYGDLAPFWDGEDSVFDVRSIKGIERLKNLKKIDVFSMTTRSVEEELRKLDCDVWIDGYTPSVHTEQTSNVSNSNLAKSSSADLMSEGYKYKLGMVLDDDLKTELLNDGFKETEVLDFGFGEKCYSNGDMSLNFSSDDVVLDEKPKILLDSIYVLPDNKVDSVLNIKNGYGVSITINILLKLGYKKITRYYESNEIVVICDDIKVTFSYDEGLINYIILGKN